MTDHTWTQIMPGVYVPVFLPPARPRRTRPAGVPAWLPKRLVRRPTTRRYRVTDATRLPY